MNETTSSNSLADFSRAEKMCMEAYDQEFAESMRMRTGLFGVVARASRYIRGPGEAVMARGLLWQRVARQVNVGERLMRSGYYLEAMLLYRSVHETIGLLELFEREPEHIAKWFAGDDIRPAYVRRRLGLREERGEIYDMLSQMSHPNAGALITATGASEGGEAAPHTAMWPAYMPRTASDTSFVADVTLMGAAKLAVATIGVGDPQLEANGERSRWREMVIAAESMWERLHPAGDGQS